MIGSKMIPDVRKPKDGPIPVEMESFGLPFPLQEHKGSKTGLKAAPKRVRLKAATGVHLAGSESVSGTEDEAASDPPSSDERYEPSIAPNEDSSASVANQRKPPLQEKAGIDESLTMVDAETSSSSKKRKSSREIDRGQIHERDQTEEIEERPEKRQKEEQRKHQKILRAEFAHLDVNDFEEWLDFEVDMDEYEHISDDFDPIAFHF